MEVKPFDYLESAEFFPNYNKVEKAIAYGILGGVPRYLEAFSPELSLEENIKTNLLTEGSFLKKTAVALLARGMVSIVNSMVLFLSSLMLGESIATLIQENDLVWVLLAVLSKLLYFFWEKFWFLFCFRKMNCRDGNGR